MSLPPWPKTWISAVLATVGRAAGDRDGAAVDEELAGRVAAERDRVAVGVAERRQHAGCRAEKLAVIAMMVVLSRISAVTRMRARLCYRIASGDA